MLRQLIVVRAALSPLRPVAEATSAGAEAMPTLAFMDDVSVYDAEHHRDDGEDEHGEKTSFDRRKFDVP